MLYLRVSEARMVEVDAILIFATFSKVSIQIS